MPVGPVLPDEEHDVSAARVHSMEPTQLRNRPRLRRSHRLPRGGGQRDRRR